MPSAFGIVATNLSVSFGDGDGDSLGENCAEMPSTLEYTTYYEWSVTMRAFFLKL